MKVYEPINVDNDFHLVDSRVTPGAKRGGIFDSDNHLKGQAEFVEHDASEYRAEGAAGLAALLGLIVCIVKVVFPALRKMFGWIRRKIYDKKSKKKNRKPQDAS